MCLESLDYIRAAGTNVSALCVADGTDLNYVMWLVSIVLL